MAQVIECGRCGVRLAIEDEQFGKPVRCPKCLGVVATDVPEAVELAEEVDPEPSESVAPRRVRERGSGVAELRPKRKRKRRPAGMSAGKRALLIGLCSVPGVLVAVLFFWGVGKLFTTPPPEVIPAERWQVVQQPGRFKVLMPGQPKSTQQPLGPITMFNWQLELEDKGIFGVSCTEGRLPPERKALPPETLLNDSCDGAMKTMPGRPKELSRTSIQLGNIPGKEMVVRVPELSGKAVMRVYYDPDAGRLFVIMIGAKGLEPDHENVKRFFGSFEIVKEKG